MYTCQRAVAELISFTEKEYVLTQRWILVRSAYFYYRPDSYKQ